MSVEVTISKAELVGKCTVCGEPATGSFDYDRDYKEDGEFWTYIRCVNCTNSMPIRFDETMDCYNDEMDNSI